MINDFSLISELAYIFKTGQSETQPWQDRIKEQADEGAFTPKPAPETSETPTKPVKKGPTTPRTIRPVEAPVAPPVAPGSTPTVKPPRPKKEPPYTWTPTKSTFKFKKGDTVLINTNAVPTLLGEEAEIIRVTAGGQRLIIRVKKTNQEFKCKPTAVVPNTLGQPVGAPAKPRLAWRVWIGDESSDPIVTRALRLHRNVSFQYVDLEGYYTSREVEPHGVFYVKRTQNELLLSKDYKMRGGDWRCFRVNAMTGPALVSKYNFNPEETYSDVDTGVKSRLMKLSEKYDKKNDLLNHIKKDDLFMGMLAYRQELKDILEKDIVHKKRHKHAMLDVEFQPKLKG